MALVVEDGSGLASANGFVAVAYADAYHLLRGNTTWTGADALKEAAIVRATFYLSNAYAWQGLRRRSRDQALAWPRVDVFDQEGYAVAFDAVPTEIEQATAEIALRELLTPGAMTPDVTLGNQKVLTEVKGIKWTPLAQPGARNMVPVLNVVTDLIGPLLAQGGGSMIQGSAVRV